MTSIIKNADGSHTIPADFIMETTVGVRQGGKTFQWRAEEMPATAIESFLVYGGQRKFNDKVGGSDTNLETKIANCEAMIANFKAGNIGRVSRESVDPITAEIRNIVRKSLRKRNPKIWAEIKNLEAREQNERVDAIFEKQSMEKIEEFIKLAKKNVAAKNVEIALDEINL